MIRMYLAICMNYWGRGLTEEEALKNMRDAGGKMGRKVKTLVYRIDYPESILLEDGTTKEAEKPYVDNYGYTCYHGEKTTVARYNGKIRTPETGEARISEPA